MDKKYFIVTAKCGHVGKNNYILIDFAVTAESRKDAARKTRMIPRVKHNHKDAIINVIEVSKEKFDSQLESNRNNPYLSCVNIQEQRSKFKDYYEIRKEKKPIVKEKPKTIHFSIIRQLLKFKSYNEQEYKEMKYAYICQTQRSS